MRVNTNMAALNAQRNMGINAALQSKATERLSSGLRINRAADDAAGLSITQKLLAQFKGLQQGSRNAQDAVSMIQTAEGALDEVHSILQRMRELGVQGANDTMSSQDRAAMNSELTQLKASLDGIADNTKFNGKALLAGNLATTVSASAIGTVAGTTVTGLDVTGALAGTTFGFSENTDQTVALAGGGITQQITVRAMENGDIQVLNFDKLGVKMTLSATAAVDGTAIGGALTAADTFSTAAANQSATFLVGAETTIDVSVSFTDMDLTALGISAGQLTVSSHANADTLINLLDVSITTVSTQRATLGANQNRLEHDIANLGVAAENTMAAKSRILDLDVPSEMVSFTKLGILQQMGTAVLAQANQAPQGVLQLLR